MNCFQWAVPGRALALALFCAAMMPWTAGAQDTSPLKKPVDTPQGLVDEALGVLDSVARDVQFPGFDDHVTQAYGIFIAPAIVRAGVVVGGSGGIGVLLIRDSLDGPWSYPAFYGVASASVGFQIGVQQSQVVMLIMSRDAAHRWLSHNFQLGGDVSVAAGQGAGVGGRSAGVYVYARSEGLYGGLSFEGTGVQYRDDWNSAYYGANVTAERILIERSATNPGADALRREIAALTGSASDGG